MKSLINKTIVTAIGIVTTMLLVAAPTQAQLLAGARGTGEVYFLDGNTGAFRQQFLFSSSPALAGIDVNDNLNAAFVADQANDRVLVFSLNPRLLYDIWDTESPYAVDATMANFGQLWVTSRQNGEIVLRGLHLDAGGAQRYVQSFSTSNTQVGGDVAVARNGSGDVFVAVSSSPQFGGAGIAQYEPGDTFFSGVFTRFYLLDDDVEQIADRITRVEFGADGETLYFLTDEDGGTVYRFLPDFDLAPNDAGQSPGGTEVVNLSTVPSLEALTGISGEPRDLATHPTRDAVYAVSNTQVKLWDNGISRTVNLNPGLEPWGVGVNPAGDTVWVTGEGGRQSIDADTFAVGPLLALEGELHTFGGSIVGSANQVAGGSGCLDLVGFTDVITLSPVGPRNLQASWDFQGDGSEGVPMRGAVVNGSMLLVCTDASCPNGDNWLFNVDLIQQELTLFNLSSGTQQLQDAAFTLSSGDCFGSQPSEGETRHRLASE